LRSNRSNNHHAKFARAEERWHDEELRDDPPRRGWRKRLTVLTLIAIGIYAYRTYYVEPGSTQARPGIIAEERPSKVIPAASDRQSGKLVQDRVGALGSGERMVSPEEQPVEPKSSTLHSAWPLPPAPSSARWCVAHLLIVPTLVIRIDLFRAREILMTTRPTGAQDRPPLLRYGLSQRRPSATMPELYGEIAAFRWPSWGKLVNLICKRYSITKAF